MVQEPVRGTAIRLLRKAWEGRTMIQGAEVVSFYRPALAMGIVGDRDTVVQYMENQGWVMPYTDAPASAEFYEVLPEGQEMATSGQ